MSTRFDLARAAPDRVAIDGATRTTYAELAAAVARRGAWLRARHPRGFAFVARPSVATIVTLVGAFDAGVPVLPLHPRLDTSIHDALAGLAGVDVLDLDLDLDDDVEHERDLDPEADTAWIATSGTTGKPKLARLSWRAFVEAAAASASRLPLDEGSAWLLAMPLAHVGGINVVTRCLFAGARIVLLPKFAPDVVLHTIVDRSVTHLSVVPAMLAALLDAPGAERLAGLRAVLIGGAACPISLLERCDALGVPALTTYGMTETCSQIATGSPADRGRRRAHHVGRPLEGTRVHITAEHGPAAPGEVGRIEVTSPAAMCGYVGEAPLARGARVVTSDRGYLDEDGELYVLGRVDDVIVTGGEKVDPSCVEATLRRIEGVRDVLVAGVPDDRFGAIVGALIVAVTPADEARVREAIDAASFATHERPRRIAFTDVLPVAASGKPDRHGARERLVRVSARRSNPDG